MPTGIRVLKWFFIILGILNIILAPMMVLFFAIVRDLAGESGVAAAIGVFFWPTVMICFGVFQIVIGLNLAKRKGWARMAAIIVGIPLLLSFPMGTALGITCLVVLFGGKGKAYFSAG